MKYGTCFKIVIRQEKGCEIMWDKTDQEVLIAETGRQAAFFTLFSLPLYV